MLIEINSRRYLVSCDKDKEEALQALAKRLDVRARELAPEHGKKTEQILLLLCLSLLEELDAVQGKGDAPPPGFERRAARALIRASERINSLSQQLDEALSDV